MTRVTLSLLVVTTACQSGFCDDISREAEGITSLSRPDLKWTVPDHGYHVLKRGDVRAVIVDNGAVDDHVLPGHRAGYSGVASLTHAKQDASLFVPPYAGLNYEHIHDGTTQPRDVLFEPRRAPMQLRVIDQHTVELYQAPTPTWKLESVLRYQILEDGTLEMTLECIPHAKTFRNGYVGLFWASYIHQPESLDIHFIGQPDSTEESPGWIRGVTPKHGVLSTHPGAGDARVFKHDEDFPLTLAFNRSKFRYVEPWYFGVSHGMAFVQMFRPGDDVRLTQSPSGGGQGNPAWDFQFFIPDYKVGQRYQMVMRAAYLPYESAKQIERDTRSHRRALGQKLLSDANAAIRLQDAGAKLVRNDRGEVTQVSLSRRPVNPEILNDLAALPALEALNLYETRVKDEDLRAVRSLAQLRSLNLGVCPLITDAGVEQLLELRELRFLNLGFCRQVTDEGFRSLARLKRLESLNLSLTELTDEAMPQIAELSDLQTLDIDNTRVTDAGLKHLTKLTKLRSIRLVGVSVTDRGLDELARLPLRHIYLRDTAVTPAGIERFRQARPQCLIKR
jgi:hypothetical protein